MKPLYTRSTIPGVLLLLLSLFFPRCSVLIMSRTDPFYKSFYEKTSLIMTDSDDKKYRSLPDKESKRKFIEEFWRRRDLDPTTDENEGMLLFKQRVDYCNKWFWSLSRSRGTATSDDRRKDMGWKTDRGRMYIILGPPDNINYEGSARWDTERYVGAHRNATEAWYYNRFELIIVFSRGSLEAYRISEIFEAIDKAKLEWISPGYREDPGKGIQYEAKFEDNNIELKLFPGNLNFKAEKDRLLLKLKIVIKIIRENKLVDTIERIESLDLSEEEVLEIDHYMFNIPFVPPEKGSYTLNIELWDQYSLYISTSNKTISFKYNK